MPFPPERQLAIEGGRISSRKHTVIALIEVDVTKPRQFLREYKARTGESLSFTAFVIACLGKAVSENKAAHAYHDWRNRLILFDEVDVNMSVEIESEGRKVEKIDTNSNHARGVLLDDGSHLDADVILANVEISNA